MLEAVAATEQFSAGLRDYYKPESIVEEILLQKIVIETARYGRVLGLEQPEPGATRPYLLHCLDKTMRYTTSTSRAMRSTNSRQCRRHGKLAKSLPLQWM